MRGSLKIHHHRARRVKVVSPFVAIRTHKRTEMTTTTTTAFGARVGTHAGGEFFQSKSDKSLLGGRGSVASTSRRRFDDDDLLDHHFGKRYGGGGRIGVVEAFGRSRRRRRSARVFPLDGRRMMRRKEEEKGLDVRTDARGETRRFGREEERDSVSDARM